VWAGKGDILTLAKRRPLPKGDDKKEGGKQVKFGGKSRTLRRNLAGGSGVGKGGHNESPEIIG